MTGFDLAFKPAIGLYGRHDPSAALFEDGRLVFAVEEERLSRQKHAVDTFPERAIEACLDFRDLTLSDVDRILLPYDPSLRAEILPHYLRQALGEPGLPGKLYHLGRMVVREGRAQLYPVRQIELRLADIGEPVPPVETRGHHDCHAASAFHPSGFDEAVVLTVDAKGEFDSTVVWHGTTDGLERIRTYEHPNSLGLFYAVVTEFLGYRMFNGEGKVMGLAPYGDRNADIESALRSVVDLGADAGADYDVTGLVEQWGVEAGLETLEDLFDRPPREEPGEFDRWEKDLAHVTQALVEETVVELAERYCRELDTTAVALAGGVALNCKLNRRVIESPDVERVFVQPVANDAGLALGAGWLDRAPSAVPELTHLYWGPDYSNAEIDRRLERNKLSYGAPADLEGYVADRLADGALVGWFQGRLELGPRALGNRSILADPRSTDARDRINEFVKHRESWRPFAPSLPEEATEEYLATGRPDPFMITTSAVPPERAEEIPAVLHPGDRTTRPHTVTEHANPRYHRVLEEFGDRTGVPVLLNTSFNDHGEPIVDTPTQAIKDFYAMGLDLLVLEDRVVEKETEGRLPSAEPVDVRWSRPSPD